MRGRAAIRRGLFESGFKKAHGADAELRRWRRQSVLDDADLKPSTRRWIGAARRLDYQRSSDGGRPGDEPAGRAPRRSEPEAPLLCADRAKKAFGEFGVAPSSLEALKQLTRRARSTGLR